MLVGMGAHRRLPLALAVLLAAELTVGLVRVATYNRTPATPAGDAAATMGAGRTPTPAAPPSPAARVSRPEPATLYPIPAPAAPPAPCPPPNTTRRRTYVPWRPPVTVPDAQLPAAPAPLTRAADLSALGGKGMWVYQWRNTESGDAAAVVRRATAAGLTQLWVRSGSSRQGFYARDLLADLLPRAHAAGLQVLVWDFAYLHDPVRDARRAVETLAYRTPDGHRIDGFSPDIETSSEGVLAGAVRVRVYLGLLQRALGDRPLVATVPRPTEKRLATYPYAAMAPYVDAFAAMVYWSCHEPGGLAVESVRRLARWGRPVHLIGQAYDMGSEGGRPGDPTPREVWRFLDAGRRAGAVGVSFYVWQTATRDQFRALGAYPWQESPR